MWPWLQLTCDLQILFKAYCLLVSFEVPEKPFQAHQASWFWLIYINLNLLNSSHRSVWLASQYPKASVVQGPDGTLASPAIKLHIDGFVQVQIPHATTCISSSGCKCLASFGSHWQQAVITQSSLQFLGSIEKTIATDWNRHLQPYETGCFNLRMLRFHRTWSSCYKHKVHWMIWLRISRLRLKKNGLSKILKRWFQWPSCESSRSTVWMEPSWSCATRQLMLHVCFANICIAKEKLLLMVSCTGWSRSHRAGQEQPQRCGASYVQGQARSWKCGPRKHSVCIFVHKKTGLSMW